MWSDRLRRVCGGTCGRSRGIVIAVSAVVGVAACGGGDPGYAGRSTREWVNQLGSANAERREDAVDALGRVLAIDPGRTEAVRALVRALGDSTDAVRVAAALALAKEGVRAAGAVPGLAAVARDSAHPRARRIAFETLGRLTHSLPTRDARRVAPQIAAALAPGLADRDRDARMAALTGLTGMRRAAAGAAPTVAPSLVGLTRDVDPAVRLTALTALAALPAPAAVVVPTAARMLADSAARVRVGAADVLRGLGDSASTAAPALIGALRDRDPDVRRAAAVALGYVMSAGDPTITAALERVRGDPDAAVRLEAEHALTQFHQHGGEDPRPPAPPEPSRQELCRAAPLGTPGC